MLKLLIVDDEVLVRMGIRTTIDWDAHGFEIVGDAADGQKALEIARQTHPDVVLTDIRMPKMDGLRLIKALKDELPWTKTVVLSCYDDFEYVREALRLGALDYIPKLSMQQDDLIKIMENVKKIIDEEKAKRYQSMKLQWQVNANLYDLRSKFFNDIIDGSISAVTWLPEGLSVLELRLGNAPYIAVCMRIDDYHSVQKQNVMGDERLLRFSMINIADEIVGNSGLKADVFHRKDDEFGIVASFDTNNAPDKVDSLCSELLRTFKLYLDISVSFGVSQAFDHLAKLRENYLCAAEAVNFRWYIGKGSINHCNDIPTYVNKCYYDAECEKELKDALASGRMDDAKAIVMRILNSMATDKNIAPYKALRECADVIHTFASIAKQYGGNLDEIKDENQNVLYDTMGYCDTLEDLKKWFGDFVTHYAEYLNRLKIQRYGREVSKALDYINQHYMGDIRLADIANYVGMNEAYFSSLFKKETGSNLTDYINAVRIEKAKAYLRVSDISIYEVADKVGYANVSYFSKVFKQLAGMSPAEYKKVSKNIS